MIQPIDFTWALTDGGGNYYYVDTAGDVQLDTSSVRYLGKAPQGWIDQLVNWERGTLYWGVLRDYSLPLQFHSDAAKILRHVYLTNGSEATVELKIYKFNRSISVWDYELFYRGDLDLSQGNINSPYYTCKTLEGGIISKIFAKDSVDYEIDIDSHPNKVWVKMDGIKLYGKLLYQFLKDTDEPNSQYFASPANSVKFTVPSLAYYSLEGTQPELLGNSQYWQQQNDGPQNADEQNFFLYCGAFSSSIPITITGGFQIKYVITHNGTGNFSVQFFVKIFKIDKDGSAVLIGTTYASPTFTQAGGAIQQGTLSVSLNLSLTPEPGCKYQLFIDTDQTVVSSFDTVNINVKACNGNMQLATEFRKEATYIPALRPIDVFKELMLKMTNQTVSVSSNLLNTVKASNVITCGDAIRGLRNAKIKISFASIHKAFFGMYGAGMYYDRVNDEIVYEKLDGGIFQNTQIADVGEVKSLVITPASDLMFKSLKVGPGNYTYDDVNGKDEFNQTITIDAPVLRANAEKDFTSPIRTDSYGAEFIRINMADKQTSDSSSDNDTWMLDIESTSAGTITNPITGTGSVAYYNLFRYSFPPATATGLLTNDTVFNMRLNPIANLFEIGSFVRSCLDKLDAEFLKYASGNKNTSVVIDDGITVYDISADRLISSLDSPFFDPKYATIEIENLQNIYTLMENPLGYLKFWYKGNPYYGFIMKIGDNPELVRTQEAKLLLTTNNNFTELIKEF